MSLCLSGIKIEKTVLEDTRSDGLLLTGGEPLGVAVGLGQRVEGGNPSTRLRGPQWLYVAWCGGI